ncbi:TPA: hypothetical protein ACGC55_003846, partial [Acinetobacter baumannii]
NFKLKIQVGNNIYSNQLTNARGVVTLPRQKSGENIIIQGWSKTNNSYKLISNRFITENRNLGIGISLDTIKFETKTDNHKKPINNNVNNNGQSTTTNGSNSQNNPIARTSVEGCSNCTKITENELKQIFTQANSNDIKKIIDVYTNFSEK